MKTKMLAPVVGLLLVLAACGGGDDDDGNANGGSSSAGAPVVAVEDNKFEPAEITVAVGDTVTWQFGGSAAHNVSHDHFASELVSEGEFEYTFEEPGEYDYVCTVHPGMEGTVVVE